MVGRPERYADVVGDNVAAVAVVDGEIPPLIAAIDGVVVVGAAVLNPPELSVTPTPSHNCWENSTTSRRGQKTVVFVISTTYSESLPRSNPSEWQESEYL